MTQQSFNFNGMAGGQIILPVSTALADYTVNLILDNHKEQLPDLSNIQVLLSSSAAIPDFRNRLLNKASELGYTALLGPTILSLENWSQQYTTVHAPVISEHARELLLVGALQEFPDIYRQSSPWVLAESLMQLFDEITLAKLELPTNINSFQTQITTAYGATENVRAALGREALLVHTLWFAMQQQLAELQCLDHISANIVSLSSSAESISESNHLYYCGIEFTNPSEQRWRQQLIDRGQLTLVLHSHEIKIIPEPAEPYDQFLTQVYDTDAGTFYDRAESFKSLFPQSPVSSRIGVYSSEGSEDEALGIDIQIRRWLLEGKRNLGIVTENRKLARRIRALLERSGISVDDASGWALSTTSASTVIERWLESIEQDFHYLAFLDFLKSPFVSKNDPEFLKTVYQLEQHIVIDENTPSDIAQYLRHIKDRQDRLQEGDLAVNYSEMTEMLHRIRQCAQPLINLFLENHSRDARDYLNALTTSLAAMNVIEAFNEDAAGQQLLSELGELQAAASLIPTMMDWMTFRNWLGRTLERFNFKPAKVDSPVTLTTLANSEYFHFDGCIIAGAEHQFLSQNGKASPFFNDTVRIALQIPTRAERQAVNFYLFRRLLCSVEKNQHNSIDILITRRATENGEEIIASPWIAALQNFHMQCYGSDLTHTELPQLIDDSRCRVILDNFTLPSPIGRYPRVKIASALLPREISAHTYQQLIDCPYQFFASRCLELAPPDVVVEALQKSDYGARIHLCLEAFHSGVKNYPGPFGEKITPHNRADAVQLLENISLAVFSRDIEDNFEHRSWLKRWQKAIPLYIEWQIEHQQTFTPAVHEKTLKKVKLGDEIYLTGRIDRIDTREGGIAVMDYKTGRYPSPNEIRSGEATQLPFYLLLLMIENDPQIGRLLVPGNDYVSAFYVDLYNQKKVAVKSEIMNPDLLQIVDSNRQRLIEVIKQLREGHEAPAWGSKHICEYCKMDVLCRKQTWDDSTDAGTQPPGATDSIGQIQ